ncbi:MAG: VOC family protein [Proteobacteria bacterium]|nr:VOC family protein [Pseudomonadota bacterium]
MNIVGVESITYGVEDLEQAIRYHQDWGLTLVAKTDASADFELVDGTTLHLRRSDAPDLPPVNLNWLPHLMKSTVREVIWGAADQATVDAVAAELSKDREVTTDADGTIHSIDNLNNAMGFAVTKRKELTLNLPEINTVGNSGRPDKPAEATIRRAVHPYRYVHVVYWVPEDTQATVDFYINRLGFKMTDDMTGGGAFLRCGNSIDHHNLFLQRNNDGYYGFQHVAYEVKDLDEVAMLGQHMEENGWRTNVGPIRHNICSSFSWYLWNPAGGAIEALSDIDHIHDGWEVRTIDPSQEGFYGHSWTANPAHRGVRPAQWVDPIPEDA